MYEPEVYFENGEIPKLTNGLSSARPRQVNLLEKKILNILMVRGSLTPEYYKWLKCPADCTVYTNTDLDNETLTNKRYLAT